MCENSAVAWSEYQSHQNNTEQAVRHKIAQDLLTHKAFCEENGLPDMYINGLDRARIIVLTGPMSHSDRDTPWTQEKLL